MATPAAGSQPALPTTLPLLAAFLLLWSSGSVATAIGLGHVNPWMFLLLRSLGTAVIAWSIWLVRRDALPSNSRQWLRAVSAGLLLQFAYQAAFFLALEAGIAPGLLALIVATQPLLTAAVTRERGALVWAGIVLGLAGLVLACMPEMIGTNSTLPGIAASCVALVTLTSATLAQSRNSGVGHWANLAVQSSVALPVFAVITAVARPPTPPLRMAALAPIAWMVLAVGIAATSLLYHLVRTVNVVTVTSVQFLVPAVTALMDFLVRHHQLPMMTLAGMAITIVALALMQRGRTTPRQ